MTLIEVSEKKVIVRIPARKGRWHKKVARLESKLYFKLKIT